MIEIDEAGHLTRKDQVDKRNLAGIRVVNEYVARLREYFDTVQIFVTDHQSDELGTFDCSSGAGNYLARTGQVQRWLETENHAQYERAVNQQPPEDEQSV
jgi:hypothetical protein